MIDKPFSPACERNREPILAVLRDVFADRRLVLEIGSGTGQHAVYFASALPGLIWQTADRESYLPGIRAWLDEAALPNLPAPRALDVNESWPQAFASPPESAARFDAAFTANTLHIMSWPEVERLFAGLPSVLSNNAKLVVYGPFRYGGQHTSASNAAFDASLREGGSGSGIRDFEAVVVLAADNQLALIEDRAMPANNRCLVFQHHAVKSAP